MPMFQILFSTSALDDIGRFRAHEQRIIFDRIEEQLLHEPNAETRNRKKLRPNQVAEWELRIGPYRVFYDVDAEADTVQVKMVGYKEHNKLLVQGKEYTL
jgi:mRNA-degrading endonuclease RelE of RelBE toxin-antitoxin system